jgi:hypothetical protein
MKGELGHIYDQSKFNLNILYDYGYFEQSKFIHIDLNVLYGYDYGYFEQSKVIYIDLNVLYGYSKAEGPLQDY